MMGAPGKQMPAWYGNARAMLTVVRFAAGRASGPQARRMVGALVALVSGCGGQATPPPPPPPQTQPAPPQEVPPAPADTWPDCGPGLAAAPLAPPCRNPDKPTMGAMEAQA